MQKFKINGQLVPKIQWKQTDGQTDGRADAIALPAALMRSMNIRLTVTCSMMAGRQESSNVPNFR